mgnify:CR=1 FL=1
MYRNRMRRIALLSFVVAASAAAGCTDGLGLGARRIERQDELIGGPTAKGKIGDYLLENDKIRVVIAAPGPTFTAGVFGGTVLDIDLQRYESGSRSGRGFDSFGESFPLANLLIPNPMNPTEVVKLTDAGFELQSTDGIVKVLKDGSDGQEAVIRVEGHSAYIFDVLKFLNRDFIDGLLDTLNPMGGDEPLGVQVIADYLAGIEGFEDLNLFGLLNRLQISFNFVTDYSLRPGESFLRQSTTLTLAPQSAKLMNGCAPVTCTLQCPNGFAVAEIEEATDGWVQYKRMCPVCACAKEPASMATFNESRDFFGVILGSPDKWIDPKWRGGIVAGDFLFYGSDAPPFAPGFGFDVDRKIFENMWQGVGTMGSPLSMDWLAGVGENVSYAWSTVNPLERRGFDCPTHRLAILTVNEDAEGAVTKALAGQADFDLAPSIAEKDAAARVRQAIVDHRPIPLVTVATDSTKDPGTAVAADQRDAAYEAWVASFLGVQGKALEARFADKVEIGLLPASDCMPAKVLVPLFTTSATAVLTHFADGDRQVVQPDGTTVQDDRRVYTFDRFLAVGEGDVATAVQPLYALRNTVVGAVTGAVYEKGSLAPLDKINVFLLRDPRPDPDDPASKVPTTYDEYRELARKTFATSGLAMQMLTDVGARPSLTGQFDGQVPPGRYLLMAHSRERGESELVPVKVVAGQTVRANLLLPAPGEVEFRVTDQGGLAIPCRVSFQRLDADGNLVPWDGSNQPELGDSRYDFGVTREAFSVDGTGTQAMAPGRYRVTASRGFEYGVARQDVEVRPGQSLPLRLSILHEVDTPDHISADFHVHAGRSTDSSLPMSLRARTAATEGVEFFVASDHDEVVDYQPYILEEALQQFFNFEMGCEVSPLEYGHYNGFPLEFDGRINFMNNPPRWPGLTIYQLFEEIRSKADGPEDAFVLQANHPRDGFMGYFSQTGMKGYDLSRKTPGMEMCNQVMEESPCDFQGMEIMNGKNLQYLHTPTVGEVERHNRCYREVIAAKDVAKFPYNGTDSVCAWLLADPVSNCAEAETKAADASLPEDQRNEWTLVRDHCRWHAETRGEFDACTADTPLLDCKRKALEGLKALSVRYQVERTPLENDAFFNTASEEDAALDPTKLADIGCSQKKACSACITANHPECLVEEKDGGKGWTPQCVLWCRDECPVDDARPCTDRFEVLEDWFHFMDVGLNVTAVGNSDSHGTSKEIGHPRTYVKVGTDQPRAMDRDKINRAYRAGRAIVSAGTYVEMTIREEGGEAVAEIGDTLAATVGGRLVAHLRVQTPSWYRVDRVEIWSNSQLVKRIFTTGTAGDIIDFEGDVTLDRPAVDAWYVAIAYGTETRDTMSPTYKREPYGNILISTVIALAADQIMASFSGSLDAVFTTLNLDPNSLLGSIELPDSYPSYPWGATNPIRVDLDGQGFTPPRAVDKDQDGAWDLPAFCSRPCDPAKGNEDCPKGQTCAIRRGTDTTGSTPVYVCQVPAPAHCVGLQKVSPDE